MLLLSITLSMPVSILISVLFLVAIITLYVFIRRRFFPIQLDRFLYAKKSVGIALYSLVVVFVSVGFIIALSKILGIEQPNVYDQNSSTKNVIWAIICQFLDPGNVASARDTGNIVAILSAIAGIFCLSGLCVSSIVSFINKRSEQWANGMRHYSHGLRKFLVIIGVNEQTAAIIHKALSRANKDRVNYVLIQTRQDVPKIRERLNLSLTQDEENHVIIYSGERTSVEDLLELHLEKSTELYILGEDMYIETEQDHDAYNMNCLRHVADYMRKEGDKNRKLRCHVNFEYQSTYTMFKSTNVYRHLGEHIEFLPFNVHEIWAKKVFVENYAVIPQEKGKNNTIQTYLSLDGEGISTNSEQTVHLFIFGMNQMGTALGVQAALLCHFPNFVRNHNLRTRITFVDYKAISEGEYFMGRFSSLFKLSRHRTIVLGKDVLDESTPWIDPMKNGAYQYMGPNFMDIEWEFIEGNAASSEVQQYIRECLEPSKNQLCTIAVSFNNPQQSIATALYLPDDIVNCNNLLQVLVYQQNSFDMIDIVSDPEQIWKRYTKLCPFGMIEDAYNGDVFDNPTAKYMNYLYRLAKEPSMNSSVNEDTLIDSSTCKIIIQWWDELNMIDKLSNIDVADSLSMKKHSIQGENDTQNDYAMSWSEHNRWITERLMIGFRPPYENEYNVFIQTSKEKRKSLRDSWKETQHIHVCICPNEMLDELVPKSHDNDKRVVDNINVVSQRALQLRVRLIQSFSSRESVERIFLDRMIPVPNKNFWIMDTPVTQGLWKRVMGTRGMEKPNKKNDLLPVVDVTWNDAQNFIRVLNKNTGLEFSLPSVEEWTTAYESLPQSQHIWHKDICNQLQPVRRTEGEGVLYDMMGNVWEWLNDKYDKTCKRICGGSYKFSAHYNSTTNENHLAYRIPNFRAEDIGFRLVLRAVFEKDIEDNATNNEHESEIEKQTFIKLEAGSFEMGADENDTFAQDDEKPRHFVSISEFYMSDVPVTQKLWKDIMDSNPSSFKGDNLPVENVTWFDAQDFLHKLNTQLTPELAEKIGIQIDSNFEFRLPTEAEWEYAARGGHQKENTLYSGSNDANEVAWHHGLTASTHEVRKKKPNILGLYDMSGNVWEWCNDWYLKNMYDVGREQDPVANAHGSAKVYRGGSWSCEAEDCRATRTTYWVPSLKASDIGFRIVYAHKITKYENLKT